MNYYQVLPLAPAVPSVTTSTDGQGWYYWPISYADQGIHKAETQRPLLVDVVGLRGGLA